VKRTKYFKFYKCETITSYPIDAVFEQNAKYSQISSNQSAMKNHEQ